MAEPGEWERWGLAGEEKDLVWRLEGKKEKKCGVRDSEYKNNGA